MSLSRDSRQERKLKALLRAQFNLKQTLERIDWNEDHLQPQVEALKSGKSVLGLPAGAAFDIQIEHESTNQAAVKSAGADKPRRTVRRSRKNAADAGA